MNEFYTTIIASIIGGGITGGFMMWQNRNNHKHDLRVIQDEDRRQENAILKAIKTEIKVMKDIFNNYEGIIDKLIEIKSENFSVTKDTIGEAINMILSYESKNFYNMPDPIVYNSNCSSIGKIKENKLRTSIVYFYINMDFFRELIRSYFIYN